MSLFENPKIEYIDKNINSDKLKEFAEEYNIPFSKEYAPSEWNVFAQKISIENGLLDVERLSFGNVIATMIGGMSQSCGTDAYIDESSIEYASINILNELRKQELSEEEEVKLFFNKILELYLYHIDKYYYKTRQISLRLSERDYYKFSNVEGETKTDKFHNLLNNYYK